MKTFGVFETKQNFSKLIERVVNGEEIGITRRGKLVAILEPAIPAMTVQKIFADIEKIRKRANLFMASAPRT
jgi:prevent-host-death family protein